MICVFVMAGEGVENFPLRLNDAGIHGSPETVPLRRSGCEPAFRRFHTRSIMGFHSATYDARCCVFIRNAFSDLFFLQPCLLGAPPNFLDF